MAYALLLARIKPVPDRFPVTWSVVPHFVDQIVWPGGRPLVPSGARPAIETAVTVAQGLSNAKHILEIAGDANTPIAAVRVYCPPKDFH